MLIKTSTENAYSPHNGKILKVYFEGKMTYRETSLLKQEFRQIVAGQKQFVVLNLRDVTAIDGSGLGAIAHLLHKIKGYGGRMKLEEVQGQPQKLLAGLRLEKLLC